MWDRWAMLAAAGLIAWRAVRWGWRLGTGGDWLAGSGAFVLGLIAFGVPLLLLLLGPDAGR